LKGVTSEVIAEVRMRAGILEVISETVVLKRTGKEYKGLCPFHGEKSPSFHVNPDKGIFKCFGCGEGGDVFAFVQKTKGLDFIDSVRELARKYGVKLAESVEDRKEYDRRSQILMLYQQASEYYIRLLNDPSEGAFARKYLQDRGLSQETIDKFKLGVAPNSWDGLLRYLTEKTKVAPSTLEEAGLIRRRQESSGHYDLFRNRLMIPICDSEGRVIAFGGRTLGDDQVKYLNSPETPIYHKGLHLFGFNLAKESVKEKDSVIVVEGYFDAITSHQFGFTNTVATLGTALTEQQAKLLVRYTDSKRVYLSFDADAAGVRAVERGIEMLSQIAEGIGIELRVIAIPGGKDPDECLRSGAAGVEAFNRAVTDAALMIDYQLEQAIKGIDVDLRTGRIEAARRVVPILALIKNAVGRGEYIRLWAMRLRVREEEILSDVSQYRRANRLDGARPAAGGGWRSGQGYNSNYNNQGYNRSGSGGQSWGKGYGGRGGSSGQGGYSGQGSSQGGYSGQSSGSQGGYGAQSSSMAQGGRSTPGARPADKDADFEESFADPFAAAHASEDESGLGSDFRGEEFEKEVAPPVRPLSSREPGKVAGPPQNNQNQSAYGSQGYGDQFNPYGNQGFSGPPDFNPYGQGGPGPQGFNQGGFNKGGFNKGGFKKGDGKFNKKGAKPTKDIADEESMPMPMSAMSPMMRRGPLSGSVEAERALLALFLTSKEDYDVVYTALADERLLSPMHQEIKNAVYGVGSTFSTMEDLQYQLMDRLAPDPQASKALIEVILKVEEFRKQKVPVQVVLKESRARLLKERLTLLISRTRGQLASDVDESEATLLQGRIKELSTLDSTVLPKIETVEELEELKRKLDAIEDDHGSVNKTETRV